VQAAKSGCAPTAPRSSRPPRHATSAFVKAEVASQHFCPGPGGALRRLDLWRHSRGRIPILARAARGPHQHCFRVKTDARRPSALREQEHYARLPLHYLFGAIQSAATTRFTGGCRLHAIATVRRGPSATSPAVLSKRDLETGSNARIWREATTTMKRTRAPVATDWREPGLQRRRRPLLENTDGRSVVWADDRGDRAARGFVPNCTSRAKGRPQWKPGMAASPRPATG
jgi:hypothetical protein